MMLNKNRYDEVRWLYKKVEPILSNNWTIIIVVVHIQIAGIFSYFIYILNTVRVNSKTVWCLKNYLDLKETKTFKFSSNLSSKLTKKAFTENRQINGLGTTVIDKLEKAFDRSFYKEWPPGGNGNRYPLWSVWYKCVSYSNLWWLHWAKKEIRNDCDIWSVL